MNYSSLDKPLVVLLLKELRICNHLIIIFLLLTM